MGFSRRRSLAPAAGMALGPAPQRSPPWLPKTTTAAFLDGARERKAVFHDHDVGAERSERDQDKGCRKQRGQDKEAPSRRQIDSYTVADVARHRQRSLSVMLVPAPTAWPSGSDYSPVSSQAQHFFHATEY